MAKRYRRRRQAKYSQYAAVVVLVAALVVSGLATRLTSMAVPMLVAGLLLALFLAWLVSRRVTLRHKRFREVSLTGIDRMSGAQFEDFIETLLPRVGFTSVEQTRRSADFGVDLLARKDGYKYAIQTKCYGAGKRLNNSAIQEVVAGSQHYKCDKTMVITNREFTSPARILAISTACELIDREDLGTWLLSARKHTQKAR